MKICEYTSIHVTFQAKQKPWWLTGSSICQEVFPHYYCSGLLLGGNVTLQLSNSDK